MCSQRLIWIFVPVSQYLSVLIVEVVVVMMMREQFLQLGSLVLVHAHLLRKVAASGSTKRRGKKTSHGYNMMLIVRVHSAHCARHLALRSLERTGGVWTTKPFTNWKKAVERMKAHAKSDAHIKASQATLGYQSSLYARSVVQQEDDAACSYVFINFICAFHDCVITFYIT